MQLAQSADRRRAGRRFVGRRRRRSRCCPFASFSEAQARRLFRRRPDRGADQQPRPVARAQGRRPHLVLLLQGPQRGSARDRPQPRRRSCRRRQRAARRRAAAGHRPADRGRERLPSLVGNLRPRPIDDALAIQTEIAETVAGTLQDAARRRPAAAGGEPGRLSAALIARAQPAHPGAGESARGPRRSSPICGGIIPTTPASTPAMPMRRSCSPRTSSRSASTRRGARPGAIERALAIDPRSAEALLAPRRVRAGAGDPYRRGRHHRRGARRLPPGL